MRVWVARHDVWPWPISSRSFPLDFAKTLLKYGTSCHVRSAARTVGWIRRTVSLTIFYPLFKFDGNFALLLFRYCPSDRNKFCTNHHNTAVVPCTKFCSDHRIRSEMRVKRNFHRIWIARETPLVKRGSGPHFFQMVFYVGVVWGWGSSLKLFMCYCTWYSCFWKYHHNIAYPVKLCTTHLGLLPVRIAVMHYDAVIDAGTHNVPLFFRFLLCLIYDGCIVEVIPSNVVLIHYDPIHVQLSWRLLKDNFVLWYINNSPP